MTAEELLLDRTDPVLLVCSVHQDQRPLKGVAGNLDWRLRGSLSRFMMNGRITGSRDEFVYVPISRHGHLRHLMLVGLGTKSSELEHGGKGGDKLLKGLAQRIAQLKMAKVAVSLSSFPFLEESKIRHALKDVEVEFLP